MYPVIHVESIDQVLSDLDVVRREQISGVFLIDHDADDDRLAAAAVAVRGEDPAIFLGVNVIKRPAPQALDILGARLADVGAIDALWSDTMGLETGDAAGHRAAWAQARKRHGWTGVLFGGVAFKHQAPVADDDLPRLARLAAELADVPTTSGAATGSAPSVEKLELLRSGLGLGPLAVASGVTPDNVSMYLPLVTHILVSTGISDADGRPDRASLARLLAAVSS